MNLTRATNSEHQLINELLILSDNDNEMGFAFPRGDIQDVEHELEVYDLKINDCFYIIKEETNVIGIIGLLELANDKALIIGPVMYKKHYTSKNVNESIKLLLKLVGTNYSRLSCDVLKENIILINVLKEYNFNYISSDFSMILQLSSNFIKNDSNFKSVSIVNKNDRNRLIEINNLFKSTLDDWDNESIDTLYEYLEEDYKIAVVTENNVIIGCIIWIWFDRLGYGRIEYLAINKTHQGKGYGGLLLDYVLSELSKVLNSELSNYFYLDLNEKNEIAYKLYLKKNFELQYQDYLFRLEL